MTRILDRYIIEELSPPFAIGVCVFTFFLVIDRISSPSSSSPRACRSRS